MFTKPVFIAFTASVLAGIPLYLMASAEFRLDLYSLPWFLLSIFILTLLTAYFGASGASKAAHAGPEAANTVVGHSRRNSPGRQQARERGNVKWFSASKGFGFITRDNGDDVFVHFRSIRGKGHRVLRDGQRVDFVISESEKGLQAEDVAVAR